MPARKLTILLLCLVASAARAGIRLCVEIEAPEDKKESLGRLVADELGHHPSHELALKRCQSRLLVQLFKLDRKWYLTARIDRQVPVRRRLDSLDELDEHLRKTLAEVLEHDPVFLAEDITRYSAIQRAVHSVLKKGHNFWRFEIYQQLGRTQADPVFSPGGAVSVNRGSDNWMVWVRVFLAGLPARPSGEQMRLSVHTGAEGGLTYEFSALGWASFYTSAGLGLEYRRYTGLLNPDDPSSTAYRNDFGPAFVARAGVRLLRWYSFDLDVFVAGRFPLYPADVDTHLDRFYPVDFQAGLGVGF